MIPLRLKSISLSNVGFVAILTTEDEELNLPIFIGVPEAQAIALQLNRVKTPRPMTHDLLKNILDLLECRVERVLINNLEKGTFYAQLEIQYEDRLLTIDSRPSDAIALALRCGVPVYAEKAVLDEAGVATGELEGAEKDSDDKAKPETSREKAGPPGPGDELLALKQKLQEAIQAEHYEEAARLRDEIKHRESTN